MNTFLIRVLFWEQLPIDCKLPPGGFVARFGIQFPSDHFNDPVLASCDFHDMVPWTHLREPMWESEEGWTSEFTDFNRGIRLRKVQKHLASIPPEGLFPGEDVLRGGEGHRSLLPDLAAGDGQAAGPDGGSSDWPACGGRPFPPRWGSSTERRWTERGLEWTFERLSSCSFSHWWLAIVARGECGWLKVSITTHFSPAAVNVWHSSWNLQHGYTNAAPLMAQENLLAAQSAVDVLVHNPKYSCVYVFFIGNYLNTFLIGVLFWEQLPIDCKLPPGELPRINCLVWLHVLWFSSHRITSMIQFLFSVCAPVHPAWCVKYI